MNIGDIFFLFRGDGARLQADAKTEGTKAGANLSQSVAASFKKQFSAQNLGKGLVQGLGLAGGLGVASIVSKFTDLLGDAAAAAREDQASQQRLGTALEANVPKWDGNTDAIERTIASRMKLGFSDDEQRDSLAKLVVATKDENKALDVQRVAMDLARLKKISLTEAGDALIKVEAGQFRALKALGIQLPKNATATEALAAVTKAARGQAEDFAKTQEGRLLTAQVKQGEALEKLGYVIMPAFTDATVAMADAVSSAATFFDLLNGKLPETADAQREAADSATGLLHSLGALFPGFELIARGMDETRDHSLEMSDRMGDAGRAVEGTMGTIEDASGDMSETVGKDAQSVVKSWDEMTKDLADDASDLIDKAFDPLIERDELVATNAELAAARRVLASGKASKAEIADAKATIDSASKDQAEHLLKLAEAGQTTSKAYATGIADLKDAIKKAKGPARDALQAILDKIEEVQRAAARGAEFDVSVGVVTLSGGKKHKGKALGGAVEGGVPVWVNENTPRSEMFVPDTRGTILNRPQIAAVAALAGAGGGGGGGVNLTLYGRPLEAESPADIVREMRRAQRLGMAPRRKSPGFKR